jgi:hypothetical protein
MRPDSQPKSIQLFDPGFDPKIILIAPQVNFTEKTRGQRQDNSPAGASHRGACFGENCTGTFGRRPTQGVRLRCHLKGNSVAIRPALERHAVEIPFAVGNQITDRVQAVAAARKYVE